ncbi:MAG: hypothetical protein IJ146_09675 [Kiritimatiellae bacterium]|nr:hypothetical protein [Kiritimatiellia bacterium]
MLSHAINLYEIWKAEAEHGIPRSAPSPFGGGMRFRTPKKRRRSPSFSFTRLKRVLVCQQKSRNSLITMTAR